MRLTGFLLWGEPPDRERAKTLLRRAVELKVNFIDTADAYGPEVSERLIAEALQPYPDGLVIATKGGILRPSPTEWAAGCRPEQLRRACEASLRRLGLDRLELYQLHTVDPKVPLEESVGALAELQAEGRVNHIGLCNVSVKQIEQARSIAPVVSIQNRFNLADRLHADVLQFCKREELALICWFPLARRELGRRTSGLGRIAHAHGATPAQIARLAAAALTSHSPHSEHLLSRSPRAKRRGHAHPSHRGGDGRARSVPAHPHGRPSPLGPGGWLESLFTPQCGRFGRRIAEVDAVACFNSDRDPGLGST